jgi:hypothetical protein
MTVRFIFETDVLRRFTPNHNVILPRAGERVVIDGRSFRVLNLAWEVAADGQIKVDVLLEAE